MEMFSYLNGISAINQTGKIFSRMYIECIWWSMANMYLIFSIIFFPRERSCLKVIGPENGFNANDLGMWFMQSVIEIHVCSHMFLSAASFGLHVLSSPASLCMRVDVPVCMYLYACPSDNLSLIISPASTSLKRIVLVSPRLSVHPYIR